MILRTLRKRNRALIGNPHIADWRMWEQMEIWKEFSLGENMAGSMWHWDGAEWHSRFTLHVHGCSWWGCVGEERLTDLSSTYLRGFLGRRSRANGGVLDADGGVPDTEYEIQQKSAHFWAGRIYGQESNPTSGGRPPQ